jgi:ketosteroid isomerase-like protein
MMCALSTILATAASVAAITTSVAATAVSGGATADAPGAAAAGAPDATADVKAVKAITAIERELAQQPSMKNLIQYYAPGAVVLDAYAPGYYRGSKEIYKGFEQQFEQSAGFTGQIADLSIVSHGELACAALQARFHFKMKSGQEGDLTFRQLDAYRKIGGKWLIVQQHISQPVDSKSGMGIADARMPVRGPQKWVAESLAEPAVDIAQARKEIVRWLATGVLSPDTDTLMKYYGPGDDVIVYDVQYPPGEFRGLGEVRAGFAPVMNFTNPRVKILALNIDTDGSFAVQLDVQDITITQKDGTQRNFMLRQSDCMRRVGGKWYSMLEEISMPIDPKSGKAVSDPASFTARATRE